ncbi:MAG: hypothetical protein ACO1O6_10265 [Bacteroidota bacterium]
MFRFFHIVIFCCLVGTSSCQKNEFQSCTNFEKIEGEWQNINGDTQTQIIFYKNGKVVRLNGLERKRAIKYNSCSYKQKYNGDDYYILFENEDFNGYYDVNEAFDTLITGSGAYEYSQDSLIYQMIFVKVK